MTSRTQIRVKNPSLSGGCGGWANTGMGTNYTRRHHYFANLKIALSVLLFALCSQLCFAQANPASFSDLASKAAAARDANDAPGAIELYRQALKLNSKWSDGWWFLGSLQYTQPAITRAARDALSHFTSNSLPTPLPHSPCAGCASSKSRTIQRHSRIFRT